MSQHVPRDDDAFERPPAKIAKIDLEALHAVRWAIRLGGVLVEPDAWQLLAPDGAGKDAQ